MQTRLSDSRALGGLRVGWAGKSMAHVTYSWQVGNLLGLKPVSTTKR